MPSDVAGKPIGEALSYLSTTFPNVRPGTCTEEKYVKGNGIGDGHQPARRHGREPEHPDHRRLQERALQLVPTTAGRSALTALAAVGAVGVGSAVWGIGIERYLYTVRRHALHLLPEGSAPIRILHVSDAHMAPWQERKQAWIASLADLQPDFIVNTGDNLGHQEGLRGLRRAFDPLRGIPGVFVHGSNDHAAPSPRNPLRYFTGPSKTTATVEPLDTRALDAYLDEDLGWTDLNNSVATLDVARSAHRRVRGQRCPPRLGPARRPPRSARRAAGRRRSPTSRSA